ncbi:hypothetical protein JR334_02055 [Clostridia bacterium]|nr:hypothetical protein JR334_02055 [Clostridia bacterium]
MDYGKRLRLIYSGKVYHVSDIEKTQLRIKNAYNEYTYPIMVTQGPNENQVDILFEDINNLVLPALLECLGCIAMGSEQIPFSAFEKELQLQGLYPVPGDYAYLDLVTTNLSGEISELFDGNLYTGDEYMQLASVDVAGEIKEIVFSEAYQETAYMQVASVSLSGQYCDINGVPL